MTTSNAITVLALNPALDVSYEVPQLNPDQKVRATTTQFHPGGNGINVSRALQALDTPMHCLSLLGGVSGDVVLQLLGENFARSHTWLPVESGTRVNVTVLQQSPPGQYEVDSEGPLVSTELLDQISTRFLQRCGTGIGVLTGSLPPGVPMNTYQILAAKLRDQGGRAAVDAYGATLTAVLEARPHLLRVNLYVLEQYVKRRLDSAEAAAEAARDLQRRGSELVCVSMASKGAVLVDVDNAYCCPVPKVHVHSTVASGDTLMAALVAGDARGDNHRRMLHRAVACGTATAAHPGTELFDPGEVQRLFDEIQVKTLDI